MLSCYFKYFFPFSLQSIWRKEERKDNLIITLKSAWHWSFECKAIFSKHTWSYMQAAELIHKTKRERDQYFRNHKIKILVIPTSCSIYLNFSLPSNRSLLRAFWHGKIASLLCCNHNQSGLQTSKFSAVNSIDWSIFPLDTGSAYPFT